MSVRDVILWPWLVLTGFALTEAVSVFGDLPFSWWGLLRLVTFFLVFARWMGGNTRIVYLRYSDSAPARGYVIKDIATFIGNAAFIILIAQRLDDLVTFIKTYCSLLIFDLSTTSLLTLFRGWRGDDEYEDAAKSWGAFNMLTLLLIGASSAHLLQVDFLISHSTEINLAIILLTSLGELIMNRGFYLPMSQAQAQGTDGRPGA